VLSLEDAAAPVELAYALIDLGAALRRDGERTNARPLLSRAYELAEAAGAGRAADAARTELRSAGGRVIVAGGGGIASLTPSERRVADLAADGRTNREIAQQLFLSPKTVETHLGNVFRKLDISSRQRLADRLRVAA
jgi:DNA-binding CsgD family transcriptional regulator